MYRRRELLQIGCSSFFGLGLTSLLHQRAQAAAIDARAKSVVLVFLTGGGSHIDMFDPKPESAEVKGEFGVIDTAIPGVQFSDQMPGMAQRADKLAIVRSMRHGDNRHLSGTHYTITGSIQPFRGNSNQDKSLHRGDWPSIGSAVSYLRPRSDRLPSQVTLPNPLIEGVLVWPAQHAGFLGPKYDPFVLKDDPNSDDYKVRGLSLLEGLDKTRVQGRRDLLQDLDRAAMMSESSPQVQKYSDEQETAFTMLTSSNLKTALDISAESDEVRDRYGRHKYGQTLLLARRLVEVEMPVIQCNMGHVQMWDTHVDHFPRLKTMLPALDTAVSALLDDLDERGLLETTLVICVGEFGRTPRISPLAGRKVPGRHHWAHGYTAVFAGGGVMGGQVIGRTDKIGGSPVTVPFSPADMGATIFESLGIDPHQMIPDRLGRPRHLNTGEVMQPLYTGEVT
ncbi:hypothetical protein Mal4_19830 [Maioricimonas rarisocia]|uniref:DUF1501 domain-containing protein n=1 Tax=Maioricimonas rarisocia TaxID=2528026 RepID=A0A517Z5D4_9PLAN|nr:DUF1501 domain-containing protein [Maioricimonas rarisocia]QDU37667.1 hypothetical protein Mal4_19830 [Maioricimonas rarisocia]